MKNDNRDGFDFRPLKGFFQQTPSDPRQTIVDLGQQLEFLRAQSRGASLAAQQLGEGGGQGGKGQQMTTLCLVVVNADFRRAKPTDIFLIVSPVLTGLAG